MELFSQDNMIAKAKFELYQKHVTSYRKRWFRDQIKHMTNLVGMHMHTVFDC